MDKLTINFFRKTLKKLQYARGYDKTFSVEINYFDKTSKRRQNKKRKDVKYSSRKK
jgi:hypothetical protein